MLISLLIRVRGHLMHAMRIFWFPPVKERGGAYLNTEPDSTRFNIRKYIISYSIRDWLPSFVIQVLAFKYLNHT